MESCMMVSLLRVCVLPRCSREHTCHQACPPPCLDGLVCGCPMIGTHGLSRVLCRVGGGLPATRAFRPERVPVIVGHPHDRKKVIHGRRIAIASRQQRCSNVMDKRHEKFPSPCVWSELTSGSTAMQCYLPTDSVLRDQSVGHLDVAIRQRCSECAVRLVPFHEPPTIRVHAGNPRQIAQRGRKSLDPIAHLVTVRRRPFSINPICHVLYPFRVFAA